MRTLIHNFSSYIKKLALPFLMVVMCILCSSFTPITSIDKHNFQEEPLVTSTSILKIYPNPATTYITFEFAPSIDKSYSLAIYSFVGKKMDEKYIETSKLTIQLRNYFRGLYVYQLKDKTGKTIETGKFQVND